MTIPPHSHVTPEQENLRLAHKATKKAEEALRETEERYRLLNRATNDIIWDWNLLANHLSWNEAVLDNLGWTVAEIEPTPQWWYNHIHPDDREQVVRGIHAVIDGGKEKWSDEYRFRRKDGSYGVFFDRGFIARDKNGTPYRMIGSMVDLTERRQAEEALRRSEQRYRSLVEYSSEGIWCFELEEPISIETPEDEQIEHIYRQAYLVECNELMAQMYGFSSAKEIIGLRLDSFLVRSNSSNTEYLSAFIRSGYKIIDAESHEVDRHGNTKYFLNNLVGIVENGVLVKAWGTQRDNTKRKQAESALRKSEERYRFLADAMAQIVWTSRPDGYLDYYNKRWYEFTGFVEAEGGDNSWKPILHPDDVELCLNLWYGAVRTGEPYEIEYRFFDRKTGSYRWHLGRALPMRNQDGEIIQWVGTCTDIDDQKRTLEALSRAHDELELKVQERTAELQQEIAERKQTEELLHQSNKRFRYLVEHAVDGFFVHDNEGRVLDVNQGACNSLGYTREELLTLSVKDFEENFSSQKIAESWQRMVPGIPLIVNGVHRRKDGTTFPVDVRVGLFQSGGRQLMHALVRDVTRQKQAEQELRKAKESAIAANRAKSEFLAIMSHEIRTPMNAVIGMTGLLLNTELTPQQRDFAETIRTSGDALLTIINDILDFSKIESGKLELESQPFDLRACIESALELNVALVAKKHLELVYLFEPNTPTMFIGDVTRLRQILVNLLSNAVKFTQAGEVVVTVSAHKVESGKDGGEFTSCCSPTPYSYCLLPTVHPNYEICFAVKDTGIGIAPERMERLFKSFSQVDSSTNRQYGGTGLGLAISKRLSVLMGGNMWVESQVGKGSTFYFTLVANLAPSSNPNDQNACQSGACWETVSHLAGKRLLIVDDNATSRKMLTLQGQSWEMIPRAAASGSEALNWIRSGERFDIALVDMQMPGMHGLTLAAEIRKQLNSQQLPLVMLTKRGHSDAARASDLDLAAFVNKPLKQSQLYDTLSSVLSGQPLSIKQSCPTSTQMDLHLSQRLPLRILLAEDHPVNQKMALLILQRLGYRADVAGNGLEVLQALRRQPYDLVLMDMQMPEMDGLEATRRIAIEWPDSVRPQIIAMTANAMLSDREQCLEAGMDDYISKPIRVEELIRVLTRGDLGLLSRGVEESLEQSSPQLPSSPAPQPKIAPTPIDAKVLQKFRDMAGEHAEAFLKEMIDCYLQESPKLLQAMSHATALKDGAALTRAAHMLKSSSASLGAITLSNLCKELEVMGSNGTTCNASAMLLQLEAEYGSVKAALLEL